MNILIVEDDPMVGKINKQFAENTGLAETVSCAESVQEAKHYLEIEEYDLVLLDVFLPEKKGTSLLSWIRQKDLSVSVILITADKRPLTVEKALNWGASDYLVKPFTYERFQEALQKVFLIRKTLHNASGKEHRFEQKSLDSLFTSPGHPEHSSHTDDIHAPLLDKGLSAYTYSIIIDKVQNYGRSFTAEELAVDLGISRVTVRRYLEYMYKNEILERHMEYGKPGRPLHYYRLRDGREK